jgi:hypothetical protein
MADLQLKNATVEIDGVSFPCEDAVISFDESPDVSSVNDRWSDLLQPVEYSAFQDAMKAFGQRLAERRDRRILDAMLLGGTSGFCYGSARAAEMRSLLENRSSDPLLDAGSTVDEPSGKVQRRACFRRDPMSDT